MSTEIHLIGINFYENLIPIFSGIMILRFTGYITPLRNDPDLSNEATEKDYKIKPLPNELSVNQYM